MNSKIPPVSLPAPPTSPLATFDPKTKKFSISLNSAQQSTATAVTQITGIRSSSAPLTALFTATLYTKVPVMIDMGKGQFKPMVVLVRDKDIPSDLKTALKDPAIQMLLQQASREAWKESDEMQEVLTRCQPILAASANDPAIPTAMKTETLFGNHVYVSQDGVRLGKRESGQGPSYLGKGAFNKIEETNYYHARDGAITRKSTIAVRKELSHVGKNRTQENKALVEKRRTIVYEKLEGCPNVVVPNVESYHTLGKGQLRTAEKMPVYNQGTLVHWEDNKDRPLEQKIDVAYQIANGVASMHKKGVYHGDIKAKNILIHEESGKIQAGIADVDGAGVVLTSGKIAAPFAHTHRYLPLESRGMQSEEGLSNQELLEKRDSWALGLSLYPLRFQGRGLKAMDSLQRDSEDSGSIRFNPDVFLEVFPNWRSDEVNRLTKSIKENEEKLPTLKNSQDKERCLQTLKEDKMGLVILQLLDPSPKNRCSAAFARDALEPLVSISSKEETPGQKFFEER